MKTFQFEATNIDAVQIALGTAQDHPLVDSFEKEKGTRQYTITCEDAMHPVVLGALMALKFIKAITWFMEVSNAK
jgi:hypothetical protein